MKSLKVTSAMLDGEIVIVDAQGRTSFQKLQRAMGKATTTGFAYEVFDLIYVDGFDLTQAKLVDRKQLPYSQACLKKASPFAWFTIINIAPSSRRAGVPRRVRERQPRRRTSESAFSLQPLALIYAHEPGRVAFHTSLGLTCVIS